MPFSDKIRMRVQVIFLLFLMLVGCRKPFSNTSETVPVWPAIPEKNVKAVAFITGSDVRGPGYYTHAKTYFAAQGMAIVDSLRSLEGIISWVNLKMDAQVAFNEIHIVSHGNAWSGMSLKTFKNGDRLTAKTLRNARKRHQLSKIESAWADGTQIVFHSCGLGGNQELLEELKRTFTSEKPTCKGFTDSPKIYASPFFTVFGGKFAGHYLARPFYAFYPTGESKGPLHLSRKFEKSYPEVRIDWLAAIKTRKETDVGVPYSYTFNIPVEWEFTFDRRDDIPKLVDREALLDFISESPEMASALFALNVPLENYRWRWTLQNDTLYIKGKTTALCVLAPILQDTDSTEYRRPEPDDRRLYQIL